MALIGRAGPEGPDEAALLALLIPDPILIRRRRPTPSVAKPQRGNTAPPAQRPAYDS
jgi:hypothetical protein